MSIAWQVIPFASKPCPTIAMDRSGATQSCKKNAGHIKILGN